MTNLPKRQIRGLRQATSALSLGSWRTFEAMEFEDIVAVIESCFVHGVNFLDDCRYGNRPGVPVGLPTTEVLVGRALKVIGVQRSEFALATKLWWDQVPTLGLDGQLARAMTRLDLDHIDLVYVDNPDRYAEANPSRPFDWDEIAAAATDTMTALIKSGTIGAYGLANITPGAVARMTEIAKRSGLIPPAVAQVRFNMVEPNAGISEELKAAFATDGTTVAATMPLAGGVLTGKYLEKSNAPRRWPEEFAATLKVPLAVSARLRDLSKSLQISPATLAIAYPLSFEHVSTVVFGARTVQQVKENLASISDASNPDVLAQLSEIVASSVGE